MSFSLTPKPPLMTYLTPTTCYADLPFFPFSSPLLIYTQVSLLNLLQITQTHTHLASRSSSSFSLHITHSYLQLASFKEEKMDMGMMEVEDDVFFADLNRQISLLITDDEDDGYYSPPISSYPTAVSIQAFSRTSFYPCSQPQYQFDQIRSYKTGSDQSKGTGVFIPKSSQSSRRRHNKHQNKINTTTANNNNFSFNSYNSSNTYKSYRQQQQQQLLSQAAFGQVINPKKC